jgi:hypothetical protein
MIEHYNNKRRKDARFSGAKKFFCQPNYILVKALLIKHKQTIAERIFFQ